MTNIKEQYNATVKEQLFTIEHPSGLEIFVVPKKHSTSFAMFGTRYGSMDNSFKTQKESNFITVPDGIAHFLEHKLFENANGEDTFTRFANYGGSANAFTSFDRTVYLFSCTENFDENLEALLDFVQNPYFTEASVQKEIGIIGQEIRMYDDNPGWQSYFELLSALYVNNPVKIDIAGTTGSIAKITADVLYKCYNTFYNLSNMTLVVSGDVTPEQVIAVADKVLKQAEKIEIERTPLDEPDHIRQKHITKYLEVAMPILAVGIKDNTPSLGIESIKRNIATDIILYSIFGASGSFYADNYEKGLINGSFNADTSFGRNYSFATIGGSTPDPDTLFAEIQNEIENWRQSGLDKVDFERSKRVLYSSSLTAFESTESIANGFLRQHFLGGNLLELPELIASISFEYASDIFIEMFTQDRIAASVILPNKK